MLAMRAKTSAIQACGSTSLSLAVMMSVDMTAAHSPTTSAFREMLGSHAVLTMNQIATNPMMRGSKKEKPLTFGDAPTTGGKRGPANGFLGSVRPQDEAKRCDP
jgi:hypothetical protein